MSMDMFFKGILPDMVENATATGNDTPTSHSMSSSVVETILPLIGLTGFTPVYQFIGRWLGWDPTYLLMAGGFIWAGYKIVQHVFYFLYGLMDNYMISTIHISSTDDIYTHLMAWLSKQPKMVNSRSLMAETARRTAWEEEDESTVARDHTGVYLNFSNQEARTPRYIPAMGLHSFWWKGQYFRLYRKKEAFFEDTSIGGFNAIRDKEDLMISCLWRSPEPIKQLLAHTKQYYYSDHQARTIVKRPHPESMRRGHNNWQIVANRPVRDMKTVVLDQEQKLQVLTDINEYLHPATPRWYANRGIPLRRGYLFHGPPGTGKTSFSFALAGVFGLDIYVISLLEPSLTEEDLCSLFSSLPRRCVVLLEDIDTAGLRRSADKPLADEQTAKEKENQGKNESYQATSNDIKELAKMLKKESEDQKKGISLSGLLNAIDGVASHEGRVLIMTTNIPESLDYALIRPGRVDLQVQFTYASKDQARELFIRMYEGDKGRPKPVSNGAPLANGKASGPLSPLSTSNGHAALPETPSTISSGGLDIAIEELPDIARQFGEKIPHGEFSPAEIQGYLLKRKKHPGRALEEADKWIAALLQQKASKTKVSHVQ
ncbi:hypothetical protein O1611_g3749 [Lasiodiplodia mahajangana]|uniref:Uncharacterized protein n=1 Tax=Lasiodiplodia mahajangana TaxID=1108764 RepID=A0ACC2JR66_9PEZI|nr:hypothetical protein O1611_g3749 [Lasiodiplodia mahajangana]